MRSSLYDVRREIVSSIVPSRYVCARSNDGLAIIRRRRCRARARARAEAPEAPRRAPAHGFRTSREVHDQGAMANAGKRARQHRGFHDRDGSSANGFGNSRHFVIEDRGGRLRRPIARSQAGSAASKNQIGGIGVGDIDQLGLQRARVVRQDRLANDCVNAPEPFLHDGMQPSVRSPRRRDPTARSAPL